MTEEFKYIIENESDLCHATIELMAFGKNDDEIRKIECHRHLFCLIDRFISFHQDQHINGTRVPIFYMTDSDTDIPLLLSEFLTVRLAIFNTSSMAAIKNEIEKAKTYGIRVPAVWEPEYKTFNKNIKINGKTAKLGDIVFLLKRKAHELSKQKDFLEKSEYNILICSPQEVCDGRNCLISDFYETSYTRDKSLYVNPDIDASQLISNVKLFNRQDATEVDGNVYMIYTNSARYKSFNTGRMKQLSQLGFHVNNLFIFYFLEKNYTLGRILNDKLKIERIFNVDKTQNDFFFVKDDELQYLSQSINRKDCQRYLSQDIEDSDIFRIEISQMLEGIRFPSSKKNILSLCCTDECVDAFYDLLEEEDYEFERPAHPTLFNTIKNQWENEFSEVIKNFLFLQVPEVAVVIDGYTPNVIKEALQQYFENSDLHFYNAGALRPIGGINQIKESNIVVIKYMRFYKEMPIYPNSYDPYCLRDYQRILEIINLPLFKNKYDIGMFDLEQTYNKLLDTAFRKQVLGWKHIQKERPTVDSDGGFFEEYDYGESTSSQNKVIVEFLEGKKKSIQESEHVIVEIEGMLELRRLSDIIDDFSGIKIQLASEIESYLSPLIEKSASNDSSLELQIRKQLVPLYGTIVETSKEELWRILLAEKVRAKGIDTVYKEVITNANISLRKDAFERWFDFDYEMILPRDRQSIISVMNYVGFQISEPYFIIMRRKKIRQKNSTRTNNSLLDELISALISTDESIDVLFHRLNSSIPDAIDLLGIDSIDALGIIKEEILGQIKTLEIKNIKKYGE